MASLGLLVVASIMASSLTAPSILSGVALYQSFALPYSAYSTSQGLMLASIYARNAGYNASYMSALSQALQMDGFSTYLQDRTLIAYLKGSAVHAIIGDSST